MGHIKEFASGAPKRLAGIFLANINELHDGRLPGN
jgi:hypothetical protein